MSLFPLFPHLFAISDGTRWHDLHLNVEFWASFFTLLFHSPIKRLFNSSSLSAIRVVSSEYLRLLIFLLAILISAYDSSSLAFNSVYKLKKQGDNIQPWHSPFPTGNQLFFFCVCVCVSHFNCYFLTGIQVSQETSKVVWYSHQFTVCCDPHSQRL